jgi:putative hydrolases of HD superfamily
MNDYDLISTARLRDLAALPPEVDDGYNGVAQAARAELAARGVVATGAVDEQVVLLLGRLVLLAGRTPRATLHEDGTTPESVTDHTVMLAVVACAIAHQVDERLDVGLVAQYALVHDLVEAYAGDTNTLRLLDAATLADKAQRERDAYQRIAFDFQTTPWLPETIAEYEALSTPEARYVKALDKVMPKITHIGNTLAGPRAQGVGIDELQVRYEAQAVEMAGYAGDFPALLALYRQVVQQELRVYESWLAS